MPLFGTRGAASVTGFGGLAKLGYLLRNSLRFRRSASATLSRTPSTSGNRKTWTMSFWYKRGIFGVTNNMLGCYAGVNDDANNFEFRFNTSDQLQVVLWNYLSTTSAVFRDPSAWYHIVLALDTTQAGTSSGSKIKVYVNGVLQSWGSDSISSSISQNADLIWNSATTQFIGRWQASDGGAYFQDCYMAEVNFINGQALTPSSFAKTDSATGQWIPIKYGSTYGTNGFYLPFTNTTSTSTLGNDFSGNSNTWTVNNISLTAGGTYDSMTDVPTLTNATTANYATINAVDYNSTYLTLNDGNLHQTYAGVTAAAASRATMAIPTTGKFYWEVYINATGGGSGERIRVGITRPTTDISGNSIDGAGTSYLQMSNGQKRNNSTDSTYGSGFSAGQYIQVLYDATAGAIYFGQNNNFANGSGSFNQTFSSATAAFGSLSGEFMPCFITYGGADIAVNFGQQPFAYTPPSGFNRLNTFNLP